MNLEAIIASLNAAVAADPEAINALIAHRVPCNQALADHPSVQVKAEKIGSADAFSVGAMGLINAVVETATGKRIAWQRSDDGGRIIGFCEYIPLPDPVAYRSLDRCHGSEVSS